MNEVFTDTSGWASFFVQTEPHHEKATSLKNVGFYTTPYRPRTHVDIRQKSA